MCLGGHLAYRAALDRRVSAAVCYFATDIHSRTLGEGMKDDSLDRAGEIKGELIMVSCFFCIHLSGHDPNCITRPLNSNQRYCWGVWKYLWDPRITRKRKNWLNFRRYSEKWTTMYHHQVVI